MIKQQVYINGVSQMIPQSELTKKVIGQDELGNDVYGDYYKYYNADMTVDIAKENEIFIKSEETRIINLVQNHLDKNAKEWGYDNIYTAIGYIGDPHIEFDLEGQMFRNWRSDVWVYVNQELAKLQQGLRTIPTEAEAIAELPLLDTYRTQLGL